MLRLAAKFETASKQEIVSSLPANAGGKNLTSLHLFKVISSAILKSWRAGSVPRRMFDTPALQHSINIFCCFLV